ncbi:helix-turn-helix domain-containing protein [Luteolibacter marinus]|uniref:helix-turn-helix domain-containing protein n=1 Tax=Luteolibacter marinus TaxID=2776705 RepID=UPI0018666217|nr:helix-turn-helix domain-containing protein [Luteolibacter marinus]
MLNDEQLDEIAERVAARLGGSSGEPLTKLEAARALKVSVRTIERRIEAGVIVPVPHLGVVRIPAGEIERLRSGARQPSK